MTFSEVDYDLYSTPFWTDIALDLLKKLSLIKVRLHLAQKKIDILMKELRTTTQRVNLFEKVKIPECQENIRRIRIYLGDQQSSAVGISKVAKKKVDARDALLLA